VNNCTSMQWPAKACKLNCVTSVIGKRPKAAWHKFHFIGTLDPVALPVKSGVNFKEAHMSAKRKRNLFDPASSEPFPLSRSKIEFFLKCPRCFYLDRRLGVKPPGMPSMTLNRAVDSLMKAEFDGYESQGTGLPFHFLPEKSHSLRKNGEKMRIGK